MCPQQRKTWGQNTQNFFFYLGKRSGCHYCCSQCHDITAVPARLRLTVRHLQTTNSTSRFLFVNILTLAEPLMLNRFTASARLNKRQRELNECELLPTHRGEEEETGTTESGQTARNQWTTNSKNEMKQQRNRSAMIRRGLCFSLCPVQRSLWMHFSFLTCISCMPVLSNIVVVKLQVKKYVRKAHEG